MPKEPFYIEKLINKKIESKRKNFKGTPEEFEKMLEEKFTGKLKVFFEDLTREILEGLEEAAIEAKTYKEGIGDKITDKYGDALAYYDTFLELNKHIGYDFYNKFYKQFENSNEDLLKLDTLILIHTRACQIAGEVRLLIGGGFADGAHARWRSLHELSVIFLFLYDNDYSVIQMYNDYEIIESVKKAREHQKNYEELGFDPIPQKMIDELEAKRQYLIEIHGKDFVKAYGWTMNVIANPSERHFRKVEELVGKSHMRALYAWASENIHGGVSANVKKLGLPKNKKGHLLQTVSEFGIIDPAQYASYSLYDISETLLSMEDSVLNKIYGELLTILQNELVNELANADPT